MRKISKQVTLIRRRAWRIVLAFITSLACYQGSSDLVFAEGYPCEVRGVWVKPPAFSSADNRKDILRKISKSNLNTLFVLAPPVKDNQGRSTHESFSALLEEAKSQGMSVHAWILNRFRVSGEVDFTLPQEQSQQVHWAMELLSKYPALDGIHLDYIRYMDWERGEYRKMESVSNTVRLLFHAVRKRFHGKLLTAAVLDSTPNYANYERDYIPQWFKTWVRAHPGNPYAPSSAEYEYDGLLQRLIGAILPKAKTGHYVPGGFKYQQDAMGWLIGDFIDAIIPMEYTVDDIRWQDNLKNWVSFRDGNPSGIYVGLGWLEEEGHPDWGYDAPGIVRKIRYGRKLGLMGFVIFQLSAFRDIDDSLVQALSVDSEANDFDAPFKTPVPSCLSSLRNSFTKSIRR